MKSYVFTILLSLILLTSCSKSGYNKEIKDNITIHKNSSKPYDKDFTVNIEKVTEISLKDYTFGGKYDISESGDIYFYEKHLGNIVMLDSTGNVSKIFGGLGSGPGEFSQLNSLFLFNNMVYVADPNVLIYVRYDLEGNFIDKQTIGTDFPIFASTLNDTTIASFNVVEDLTDEGMMLNFSLFIQDKNFNEITKLFTKSYKIDMTAPFTPTDYLVYFDADKSGNIAVAENSTEKYQINIYDNKGKLKEIIKKDFKKTYFTDSEIEDMVSFEEQLKESNGFSPDFSKSREKNSVYGVVFDKDDRLWVLTSKDKNMSKNKFLSFDIYENGKYLNTVEFKGIRDNFENLIHAGVLMKFKNNKIYTYNYDLNKFVIYRYSCKL